MSIHAVTEYVGDKLWSSEGDHSIVVRSAIDPNIKLWSWHCSGSDSVTSLLALPAVDIVVAGYSSGVVRMFHTEMKGEVRKHGVHKRRVNHIILAYFSPRSHVGPSGEFRRCFYTCSADCHVKLWGYVKGDLVQDGCLEGSTEDVRAIAMVHRRPLLVGVCSDFTVRVWHRQSQRLLACLLCDVSHQTPEGLVHRVLCHALGVLSEHGLSLGKHAIAETFRGIERTIGPTWDHHGETHKVTGGKEYSPEPVECPEPLRALERMPMTPPHLRLPVYPSVPSVTPPQRSAASSFICRTEHRRAQVLVGILLGQGQRAMRMRFYGLWRMASEGRCMSSSPPSDSPDRTLLLVLPPSKTLSLSKVTLFMDMVLLMSGPLLGMLPQAVDVVVWVPISTMMNAPHELTRLKERDMHRRITQCVVRDPDAFERATSVKLQGLRMQRVLFFELSVRFAAKIDVTRTVVLDKWTNSDATSASESLSNLVEEVALSPLDVAESLRSSSRHLTHSTEAIGSMGPCQIFYLV